MADIRVNPPVQHSPRPEMSPQAMEQTYSPKGGTSKLPWIILVIVVVVLGVLGVLFRDKLTKSGEKAMVSKPSGYQSVFLTNGQVYFGKVSESDSKYVTMKDIYYLQVTQQLQPTPNGQQQQQQQAQQQLQLVKLGNELHGPVDEMKINPSQILFIEDMKEDGKVMQAIREYQKNPNGAQNPSAGQQQTTPPPASTPAPKETK